MNVRNAINTLFGSQLEAARQLGFSDRTVRYWIAANQAPPHVEKILQRLLKNEISVRHARRILRTQRERRAA